jgi:hypothetical protein
MNMASATLALPKPNHKAVLQDIRGEVQDSIAQISLALHVLLDYDAESDESGEALYGIEVSLQDARERLRKADSLCE